MKASAAAAVPSTAVAPTTPSGGASAPPPLDGKALFYMSLLAVQFGMQPILTRRYTPAGITRSTVVLVQEVIKFCIASALLTLSGKRQPALQDWNVKAWMSVAVVPSALYSIQNFAALTAYQNLDALTFNVLNQTKTLSAAFCCYVVMGRRQSLVQIGALFLLLLAALVMEGLVRIDWLTQVLGLVSTSTATSAWSMDAATDTTRWQARHFTHGVAPLLLASFISGLAGALTQKSLQGQGGGRDPYLFSMELCAASVLFLAFSLTVSPDGQSIAKFGFWQGWTWQTLIPILTNSVGGIIVGLVTKYAGSVRKGFALIFGILLSGIVQSSLPQLLFQSSSSDLGGAGGVTKEQVAGGLLAAVSLYLHATNPPTTSSAAAKATKATTRLKQE